MNRFDIIDFGSAPFEIIDGDRGKNYPKQDDFSDKGFCLFLNAGNVTQDGFNFAQCQFILEQKDDSLRKGKLQRNDVVLTTRGTIGNSAFYNDSIPYEHMRINSGMVILRCEREKVLPEFLYHYLRSSQFHGQVNSLRSGVAQPQLPIRDMRRLKLPLPKLAIQQSISDILSAYDDLIENNRRRIQLLEQAARLLYKEWFIRLRFPGHQHVKVKNGIPEGWKKLKLSEIAEVNRSNIAKNYRGNIEYVDISAVIPGKITNTISYRFQDAPSRARRKPDHGDIIWSCVRPNRRSYAVIFKPPENLIVSTGFAVLSPKEIPSAFLYQAVTTEDYVGYLTNNARGAAYPAVTAKDFQESLLLIPTKDLLEQFNKIAEPIQEQIHGLQMQSHRLAEARDILLPCLMNGEITV